MRFLCGGAWECDNDTARKLPEGLAVSGGLPVCVLVLHQGVTAQNASGAQEALENTGKWLNLIFSFQF